MTTELYLTFLYPFIMDITEIEEDTIADIIEDIEDILFESYSDIGMEEDEIYLIIEELEEYLNEYITIIECLSKCYDKIIDEDTKCCRVTEEVDIDKSIKRIETYKGGLQRTIEWYKVRFNMLTASIANSVLNVNVSKRRGLSVIRDKIIMPESLNTTYNKYNPNAYGFIDDDDFPNTPSSPEPSSQQISISNIPSNPDASYVRGTRYEPIIRNLYSKLNDNVEIGEYECIPHPTYSFIGASPDGIILNGKNKGTMLEIKCPQPESAIKDGKTVRPEYWDQIQVQLNVCDLMECNYIRAVVYDSDTINGIKDIIKTQEQQKQIDGTTPKLLTFGTVWMDGITGEYVYEKPNTFVKNEDIYVKPKTEALFIRHYIIMERDWLVLNVKRNKEWFEKIYVPQATYVWNEILEARKNPIEWMEKYPKNQRKKTNDTKMYDNTICVFKDFDDN